MTYIWYCTSWVQNQFYCPYKCGFKVNCNFESLIKSFKISRRPPIIWEIIGKTDIKNIYRFMQKKAFILSWQLITSKLKLFPSNWRTTVIRFILIWLKKLVFAWKRQLSKPLNAPLWNHDLLFFTIAPIHQHVFYLDFL